MYVRVGYRVMSCTILLYITGYIYEKDTRHMLGDNVYCKSVDARQHANNFEIRTVQVLEVFGNKRVLSNSYISFKYESSIFVFQS